MKVRKRFFLIRVDAQGNIIAAWNPDVYPLYDKRDALKIDYDDRLFTFLTIDGIPLYKWDGLSVLPRAPEEIQADRDKLPPPPVTDQERITHLEEEKAALEKKVQTLEEEDAFNKECLMEMSAIVYA